MPSSRPNYTCCTTCHHSSRFSKTPYFVEHQVNDLSDSLFIFLKIFMFVTLLSDLVLKEDFFSPIKGGIDAKELFNSYISLWIQDKCRDLLELCKLDKVYHSLSQHDLKVYSSCGITASNYFIVLVINAFLHTSVRTLGKKFKKMCNDFGTFGPLTF